MSNKNLLIRLVVLLITIMCAIGAAAAEAYACFTSWCGLLTFYYDNQRSSRTDKTYDLNTGYNSPGWHSDGTDEYVLNVHFHSSFAAFRPRTTYGWFCGMKNLTSISGVSSLNTSEVTNMAYMFYDCSKLTSLDVSGFNTSKVTNMNGMFMSCDGVTSLDLSNFNTSKVTNMNCMFEDCINLTTIYAGSRWSTAGVTESTRMFNNCPKLVGGKGTTYSSSHIDKAYAHIDGGASNPGYFTAPIEPYACYTPSNTTLTFYYDNLRSSRSGTTYDMNSIWDQPDWRIDGTCTSVTKVVFNSSFAGARPISTSYWFNYMHNLQSITGLNYLNTSEVKDMTYMFAGSYKLTSLDVSGFNTSQVTSIRGMFLGCTGLTSLDLSNFNTSRVTDMEFMFNGCTNLRTIYAGTSWSTSAVTSSDGMFIGCTSLVGGKGTTYNVNYVDKIYARIDGGTSNPGYFTAAGTEAYACYTPSNTTLTFYYDNLRSRRSGTTYDLNRGTNDTGWDTDGTKSNVTKVVFDPSFAAARPTTTYDWFYLMRNLQSISGISYLNTSEVTNMTHMFNNCSKLTSLDLSSFNTSKVTDIQSMFYKCSNLQTIYVGEGWTTAAVTNSKYMFINCTSLVGGKGTTYDANHIDKAYAHIDGGTSNPGYFTEKNAGLRGDVNSDNTVNISDAIALISAIVNDDFSGVNMVNADVNYSGTVDISDVIMLINYVLNESWP